MYGLLRILFFLVSKLPFAFFYALSDLVFVLLYYVIKYRRSLVDQNLQIAFPDKTANERRAIARSFYRNFTDTFAESIKLLSLSPKKVADYCEVDISSIQELAAEGKSIQLMVAHQFNWEYLHLVLPTLLKIPTYFLYRPIETPALEKIYFQFRSKGGGIPVSADEFAAQRSAIFLKPVVLVLGADQNPGRVDKALWVPFFNRPAPFFMGPAKGAIQQSTAVAMLQLKRKQRGYYQLTGKVITENATNYSPEQLTFLYKNEVERVIQEDPSNYLWSHRRWRHSWQPEYRPIYDPA
ncbi:MAG: lysophospholipid acyltransferase family protein [Chitinophagaceae bacterium]